MGRIDLLKQSFWIMLRHPALWVVSLFGSVVIFTISAIFPDGPVAAIIRMLVTFATIALTSGALISMIDSLAAGRTATVLDGMQAGIRRMMSLAIIELILMIPTWIILVLLTGTLEAIPGSALGQPASIQALNAINYVDLVANVGGLIILSTVITGILGLGAKRAVMLEDQNVVNALQYGWRLLRSHWKDYLLMGLMMLFVAVMLGTILAFITIQFVSSTLPNAAQSDGAIDPAMVFGIVMIVPPMLINALIEIFASSAWTLAYRQWRTDNVITPSAD